MGEGTSLDNVVGGYPTSFRVSKKYHADYYRFDTKELAELIDFDGLISFLRDEENPGSEMMIPIERSNSHVFLSVNDVELINQFGSHQHGRPEYHEVASGVLRAATGDLDVRITYTHALTKAPGGRCGSSSYAGSLRAQFELKLSGQYATEEFANRLKYVLARFYTRANKPEGVPINQIGVTGEDANSTISMVEYSIPIEAVGRAVVFDRLNKQGIEIDPSKSYKEGSNDNWVRSGKIGIEEEFDPALDSSVKVCEYMLQNKDGSIQIGIGPSNLGGVYCKVRVDGQDYQERKATTNKVLTALRSCYREYESGDFQAVPLEIAAGAGQPQHMTR